MNKKSALKAGDVLVVRSGAPGTACIVTPAYEGTNCIDIVFARPDTRYVIPEYLAAFTNSSVGKKHVLGNQGGLALKHFNVSAYKRMGVTLPSLPEQCKIAEILRTWDEAIEKLETLRAAKTRLLNYKYTTIFHPGSPTNSGWSERRIGDFVDPRVEKALPSTKMPLYSLTIEDGITPKTERYNRDFLVKDRGAKTYKIAYPGDIVFNPANLRWSAIARSYASHPVVVSPIYEVLETNSGKIDLDYLNHALTCPYQIRRFATKVEGTLVERMAVKLATFLMTKILVPDDREEQGCFSRIFNTMETEIQTLSRQKALIERQKRGLMQKLLTGEWRVTP